MDIVPFKVAQYARRGGLLCRGEKLEHELREFTVESQGLALDEFHEY